ncbi:MAG: hypothetical protein BYD32DRAFT_439344 [Podila humilis]|nr:MAG: hypothetical protein BYD32DRAFT_439344 [Podila humilis]
MGATGNLSLSSFMKLIQIQKLHKKVSRSRLKNGLTKAEGADKRANKDDARVVFPSLAQNGSSGFSSEGDVLGQYVLYDLAVIQTTAAITPAKFALDLGRPLRVHSGGEEQSQDMAKLAYRKITSVKVDGSRPAWSTTIRTSEATRGIPPLTEPRIPRYKEVSLGSEQ